VSQEKTTHQPQLPLVGLYRTTNVECVVGHCMGLPSAAMREEFSLLSKRFPASRVSIERKDSTIKLAATIIFFMDSCVCAFISFTSKRIALFNQSCIL
jgi:hypothetical protein